MNRTVSHEPVRVTLDGKKYILVLQVRDKGYCGGCCFSAGAPCPGTRRPGVYKEDPDAPLPRDADGVFLCNGGIPSRMFIKDTPKAVAEYTAQRMGHHE